MKKTIDKNIEIALMIGWIKYSGLNPRWYNSFETNSPSEFFNLVEVNLKFHSDANWQLEAIDYLEKSGWNVNINGNEVCIYDNNFKGTAQGVSKTYTGSSKKEAIFESLYQFSQYLKTKNEKLASKHKM